MAASRILRKKVEKIQKEKEAKLEIEMTEIQYKEQPKKEEERDNDIGTHSLSD